MMSWSLFNADSITTGNLAGKILSRYVSDGLFPMKSPSCLFCSLPLDRVIDANEHGQVIRDGYPVSPGHTLVIPRRHIGSFFDLGVQEREGLMALLDQAKHVLDASFHPDGYNIGINDGPAAGQTVPHLHIHLIPRYHGDLPDPRGGVRWVIPGKARYW
jgi:diadenosine tetraphosphate (Ap4A) HIT family hydrolase